MPSLLMAQWPNCVSWRTVWCALFRGNPALIGAHPSRDHDRSKKGFTSHNGRDLGMPKTRYFSKPVGLLGALLEAELRASGNKPITISFDSEGYQSGIYRHSCNSSFLSFQNRIRTIRYFWWIQETNAWLKCGSCGLQRKGFILC